MTQTDTIEYDIEYALQNMEQYDNATQLDILKKEIMHIVVHNITPSEGWYDDRFKYIKKYSEIEWNNIARRFHGKNKYIHASALEIIKMCNEILEECSTRPNFDLVLYFNLIHAIQATWLYYKQLFVAEDEEDEDMVDLAEAISRM